MPRLLIWLGIVAAALTLLPLGWLAVSRTTASNTPRIQVVPDMDAQPKQLAQTSSAFFADGFAARQPVEGTVARDESPILGRGFIGRMPRAGRRRRRLTPW